MRPRAREPIVSSRVHYNPPPPSLLEHLSLDPYRDLEMCPSSSGGVPSTVGPPENGEVERRQGTLHVT